MMEASRELSEREQYQQMLPFFGSAPQPQQINENVPNFEVSSYQQKPYWPLLIKHFNSTV